LREIEKIGRLVVQKLFDAGYTAYFAGGWVRDFIRGEPSDEIDIATSAPPDKVCALFPKTIPVGVAFGVIIVVEEGEHFEVTTFRKDHPYLDGRHPTGVDFSTPEKDAHRRDFTINGMFYDPLTETIYDFVGGQDDLQKGIIRAIGDPHARFVEDRLRMVRAIRFSARFGFSIEKKTEQAIHSLAHTLFPAVSIERIWQELTKMSKSPRFAEALLLMHETRLLATIFPEFETISLEELQKRVCFFPYFPIDCPTLLFLLELFPDYTLEQKESLCFFLKLSKADRHLMEFWEKASTLTSTSSLTAWAHLYAHPHADLFIEVQTVKQLPPQRELFAEEHAARRKKLSHHIKRIECRHPLLSAGQLRKAGILPGKKMGLLLREAERLTIENNLTHASEVLHLLKSSELWNLPDV